MSSMFAPPKLRYQAEVNRRKFWRRLPMLLLGVGGAAGAYWALSYSARRGDVTVDGWLLDIGRLVAAVLAGYLAVLAGLCLYRALTRRNERIKVFDKGFTWRRMGRVYKYSWSQIDVLREGAGGIYLRRRPLLTWGKHRLMMDDNKVFTFKPTHGDPRRFIAAVRRPVADVTGQRMASTLREESPVVLTKGLTVFPGGIEARRKEIPWSRVNVVVKGGTLRVQQKRADGRFKTVARYRVSSIDNLGGFMELAYTTIRNHQPERFGKKRETAELPRAKMAAKPQAAKTRATRS
jgi:hypothetical protein